MFKDLFIVLENVKNHCDLTLYSPSRISRFFFVIFAIKLTDFLVVISKNL